MIGSTVSKGVARLTMCGIALACAPAFGQPSSATSAPANTPPGVDADEEIVVIGKSPTEIRAQMQIAEQAVYDRFNDINSNDEFDIHCHREALTGSNVLRRVCQANFWRNAEAHAGAETVRSLQGSANTIDPAEFLAEAQYKRRLLTEEMQRLASQDEELQKDLWRLGNLKQALDRSEKASSGTASVEQTAAQGALPYDAALAADVRIGRKPWTHMLTERTFTFAHVNGTIEKVDVKCRGRNEALQYEPGAEWTLPADWGACSLRVDAPRGTTFSLFQFQ